MKLTIPRIKKKGLSILKRNYLRFKIKTRSKNKIFVIGRNKTGTTSIKHAFLDLNFIVGNQREAELLQDDYLNENFDPIIKYCKTAEIFQDFPFSFPNTYKELDKAFPKSKFILTVRDNPEQWYNSVTKFHAKIFGKGKTPTVEDLKESNYVSKGWMWRNILFVYQPKENDLYNKETLMNNYIAYNNEVIEYFKERPNDLLVLNLVERGAYQKFVDFIGVRSKDTNFPWENKTSKIETKK